MKYFIFTGTLEIFESIKRYYSIHICAIGVVLQDSLWTFQISWYN